MVATYRQGQRLAINATRNETLFNLLSPGTGERLGMSVDSLERKRTIEPVALLDLAERLLD